MIVRQCRYDQTHVHYSRHQYALICAFIHQIPESLIRHGEYMRLCLFSTPSLVHVDVVSRVNRKWTVRIYCYKEQSGICLKYCKLLAFNIGRSQLTYIRSAWYRMCRLWMTDGSLRCVSSAMSPALSNLAGFTLSTVSASTSCCVPSSHWTRIWPSGSSSTTQPRTNAVLGSRSQTYRFPEKSFSPSIPRTSDRSSESSPINWGANVPAGVLLRIELDRNRVESLRFSPALLSCDRDGFRTWPILFCDSTRLAGCWDWRRRRGIPRKRAVPPFLSRRAHGVGGRRSVSRVGAMACRAHTESQTVSALIDKAQKRREEEYVQG
jgi:hypothetical protein